jgi:hypothetical protein
MSPQRLTARVWCRTARAVGLEPPELIILNAIAHITDPAAVSPQMSSR